MKSIWIMAMALLLVCAGAFASSGTVILVSNNEADAAVAEVAAEVSGATVVTTEWGNSISGSMIADITAKSPERVLIIGGPVAIPSDTETKLNDLGITTIRISGSDRYATSSEVASYFWKDAPNIILIQGDDTDTIKETIADAKAKGIPIMFVRSGEVPKSVLDTLNALGIDDIELQIVIKGNTYR